MGIKNLKVNCKQRDDGIFVCQPEFEQDGKRIVTERPMELKLEGGQATILDSGDLNREVLAEIKRHVEENILG